MHASIAIDPVATLSATGSVGGSSGTGTATVTVSGSVQNAACGVHQVTVFNGQFPATQGLQNFGNWSAQIPLAALEGKPSCSTTASGTYTPAEGSAVECTFQATSTGGAGGGGSSWQAANAGGGGGGGSSQGGQSLPAVPPPDGGAYNGVLITAQASIAQDPSRPDRVVSTCACVAWQPTPPAICSVIDLQCPSADASSPRTVCQLPHSPGESAVATLYTDSTAVGRAVSWKSAAGASDIQPLSPVVLPITAAQFKRCQSLNCGPCVGAATANIIGSALGLDTITASVDGTPSAVASISTEVQGPATVAFSSATLSPGSTDFLLVSNPFSFSQSCTIALPTGLIISPPPDSTDCSVSDGGTRIACSLTATETTFPVVFDPDLTASSAGALGLCKGLSASVVCDDPFGQASSASMTATWPCHADGGASDGGHPGTDAGVRDGSADSSPKG